MIKDAVEMRKFLFLTNLCVSGLLWGIGAWIVFELLFPTGDVVREVEDTGILFFLCGGAFLGAMTTGANALFVRPQRCELKERPILFHCLNVIAIMFFILLGLAIFVVDGVMSSSFEKFIVTGMTVLLVCGYRAALPPP